MQQETQLCIYCGIRPAIENEHVIGNVFYIQRPKKAITVPSCSACNRGRGDGGVRDLHLDEEYMRTILCMAEGCENHPVVIALLEGNIARSFRRRHRGLRQRLVRGIQRRTLVKITLFLMYGSSACRCRQGRSHFSAGSTNGIRPNRRNASAIPCVNRSRSYT